MVTLVKQAGARPDGDPYAGLVRVHATPCYDLLVSLRALFNPRTYETTRAWAVAARRRLPDEAANRGVFFFRGHETSLGYGVTPLVATLPDGAEPQALIDAVRAMDPKDLAMLMLDTGETSDAALAAFRDGLDGKGTDRNLTRALRGTTASWAKLCRRVIEEPEWAQQEFALLLEDYLAAVFRAEVGHVVDAIAVEVAVAGVADAVAIGVFLSGVRRGWAVVHVVVDPVAIRVGRVAGIAGAVAVGVFLSCIRHGRAVVPGVVDAVAIVVGRCGRM